MRRGRRRWSSRGLLLWLRGAGRNLRLCRGSLAAVVSGRVGLAPGPPEGGTREKRNLTDGSAVLAGHLTSARSVRTEDEQQHRVVTGGRSDHEGVPDLVVAEQVRPGIGLAAPPHPRSPPAQPAPPHQPDPPPP